MTGEGHHREDGDHNILRNAPRTTIRTPKAEKAPASSYFENNNGSASRQKNIRNSLGALNMSNFTPTDTLGIPSSPIYEKKAPDVLQLSSTSMPLVPRTTAKNRIEGMKESARHSHNNTNNPIGLEAFMQAKAATTTNNNNNKKPRKELHVNTAINLCDDEDDNDEFGPIKIKESKSSESVPKLRSLASFINGQSGKSVGSLLHPDNPEAAASLTNTPKTSSKLTSIHDDDDDDSVFEASSVKARSINSNSSSTGLFKKKLSLSTTKAKSTNAISVSSLRYGQVTYPPEKLANSPKFQCKLMIIPELRIFVVKVDDPDYSVDLGPKIRYSDIHSINFFVDPDGHYQPFLDFQFSTFPEDLQCLDFRNQSFGVPLRITFRNNNVQNMAILTNHLISVCKDEYQRVKSPNEYGEPAEFMTAEEIRRADIKLSTSILTTSSSSISPSIDSLRTHPSMYYRYGSTPRRAAAATASNRIGSYTPSSSSSYNFDDFGNYSTTTSTTPRQRKPWNPTGATVTQPSYSGPCRSLFTYPEGQPDAVTITTHDLARLEPGIFLNDNLIDYDLKFILSEVPKATQSQVFIYSSFFYRHLSSASLPIKMTTNSTRTGLTGYDRVRNWTKDVDIFDKEYLIIPINENLHWYLAIICQPRNMLLQKQVVVEEASNEEVEGSADEKDTIVVLLDDESEGESESGSTSTAANKSKRQIVLSDTEAEDKTRIYILDSLASRPRNHVIQKLKIYLQYEAAEKLQRASSLQLVSGHNPKLPQQDNFTDCGLFTLQYVQEFLHGPPAAIMHALLERGNQVLKAWFPGEKAQARRLVLKERIEAVAGEMGTLTGDADIELCLGNSSDVEEILHISG